MKAAIFVLVLVIIAAVCECRVRAWKRKAHHIKRRGHAAAAEEKVAKAVKRNDDYYGGDGYGGDGYDGDDSFYYDGDGDYENNSEYYDEDYNPDTDTEDYNYENSFYTYSEEDLSGENGGGGGGGGTPTTNPGGSGGAGNGNCDEKKVHHHGSSDTCGLQAAQREYEDLKKRSSRSWAYRHFFRRIVGGKLSMKGEWPWIVSIQAKDGGGHFCGGTLINSCYVLTASHCLFEEDGSKVAANSIILDIGQHSIQTRSAATSVRVDAKEVIPHPQYNKETTENDIALIRLAKPVKFNKLSCPGCLPHTKKDNMFKPGRTLITAGWGTVKENGELSPKLKHVRVSVRDPQKCLDKYGAEAFNKNKCICAGGKRVGHDSCQGDSGGPIMGKVKGGKFAVVGVVSYGDGCANGSPAVYTRIKHYFQWIKATVKDCCSKK